MDLTWKITVFLLKVDLSVAVGCSLVLEALGRLLVGLPVDAADAGSALQLHVAVRREVLLRRQESKT